MPTTKIPLESKEQSKFVVWLRERGIKLFTCTLQDAFLGFGAMRKYKSMGLQKGLSDMIVCLPAHLTLTGQPYLLFVEMKRLKRSRTSPEQKEWIEFINNVQGDLEAVIARGHQEAIECVERLLKPREEAVLDPNWINTL